MTTGQRSLYLSLFLMSIPMFPPLCLCSSFPAYQVTLAQTSKPNSLDPLRFHSSRGALPTPSKLYHVLPRSLPVSIHLPVPHTPVPTIYPPLPTFFLFTSGACPLQPPCTLCLRAKLLPCSSLFLWHKRSIWILWHLLSWGHPKRWFWSIRLMRFLNFLRSATIGFYLCYGAKWEPAEQRQTEQEQSSSVFSQPPPYFILHLPGSQESQHLCRERHCKWLWSKRTVIIHFAGRHWRYNL